MSKLKLFVQSLIQEIKYKITWPPYGKLQSNALLVLVASFIFALFIGLMDLSLREAFIWFYNAF
ncbi:preprotein translocase subunit SecE [Candidatus Cardinium hertigii]|uniref:Protein translocase subunit SecE n=1 Tax=Candidatus Cardinium hertigii TaxID=247481 RepID=A0A2Z3L6Q9_9BACT|nr:preprotein translocase subunit SecE [Candidatus Cardinium hertigii]AWN81363.1 Protein translocase subunit SecE [Candidatus Cardinium hertigii]